MNEKEWEECKDPEELLNYCLGHIKVSERKYKLYCQAVLYGCNKGPFKEDWTPGAMNSGFTSWAKSCSVEAQPNSLLSKFPNLNRAELFRDIIGNPFRPIMKVGVDWKEFMHHEKTLLFYEKWLTPTVVSLAKVAYENPLPNGSLDRLTLLALADALEEVDCDDWMLSLLRVDRLFYRGFWVIDLILEKE